MTGSEIMEENEILEEKDSTETGTMFPGAITVTPGVTSDQLDENSFLAQYGGTPSAPSIQGVPLTNGVAPDFNTWMSENGYDPDGDFAKAKSDLEYSFIQNNSRYGENAERLAQMGLSGAGVSDIYQLGAFNSYMSAQNDLAARRIDQNKAYRKEFNAVADTYQKNRATDKANAHNLGLQYYDTKNGEYVRQILTNQGYSSDIIDEVMNTLSTYDEASLPMIKQMAADDAAYEKYVNEYNASLQVDISNAYNYGLQYYNGNNEDQVAQWLSSMGYMDSVVNSAIEMLGRIDVSELPTVKQKATNRNKINDTIYNEWDGTEEGKTAVINKLLAAEFSEEDINAVFEENYGEGFDITTLKKYVSDDTKAAGIYSELMNSGAFKNFGNTDEEREFIKAQNPGISEHIWNKVFKLYRKGYKLTVEDWKELYIPQIIEKFNGENEQDLRDELRTNGVSADIIDQIINSALYKEDGTLKDKNKFPAWVERKNNESDAFNEVVRSVTNLYNGENEDEIREQLRSEYIESGVSPSEVDAKVDEVMNAALYKTDADGSFAVDEDGNYILKDKSNFSAWGEREKAEAAADEGTINELFVDYAESYTPNRKDSLSQLLEGAGYSGSVVTGLLDKLDAYYNSLPEKERPGYIDVDMLVGEVKSILVDEYGDTKKYTGSQAQKNAISGYLKGSGLYDEYYGQIIESLEKEFNNELNSGLSAMINGDHSAAVSYMDIIDAKTNGIVDEDTVDIVIGALSGFIGNSSSLNNAYSFVGASETEWKSCDDWEKVKTLFQTAQKLDKNYIGEAARKALCSNLIREWFNSNLSYMADENEAYEFKNQIEELKGLGLITKQVADMYITEINNAVVKDEPVAEQDPIKGKTVANNGQNFIEKNEEIFENFKSGDRTMIVGASSKSTKIGPYTTKN